ncbi:MAG: hypothetical protein FWG38_07875, partial [Defluviitaleaceae bacterium]|nr:hypothetical protein [Defluviitaleaceae bacterium]
MWYTPQEARCRKQICLNGSWQFQPMAVPAEYVRNTGAPPDLKRPLETDWHQTPIHIPSPWNGNTWGGGRPDRALPDYSPDSVYYPSYPPEWDHVEMGWLRRTFTVPQNWAGLRVVLHFEAVMGFAEIYINGQKAPEGEHFDGYLPFDVNITDLVTSGENTLEVGVRRLHLYNKQSKKYKKMLTPYAHGSNTQGLGGIWQDVYLLGIPPLFISDVFVKPLLDTDTLAFDITIKNLTDKPQTATLYGEVLPDTGDTTAMALAGQNVMVSPHSAVTVTCKGHPQGRLQEWTPDTPHLYRAMWNLSAGEIKDCSNTRFGWRQIKLAGKKMLLNGQEINLVADICHPFGPFMFTRPHIESWYRLIKSVGGNAVRLHAQIHPRLFLDIADEMGLMVLDETAIFGSCLTLNFEEPQAWERYAEHFDGLILRDRNHPSVFGWSFGNELFAVFLYDEAAKQDEDGMYARIFELGNRARLLDPTREFVTCDGDEDLRGTLPVWSKHYGHGIHHLPTHIEKPMVVGESGGTYYARPQQMAEFNGDKAYADYAGRANALGIDLYANIRHFGKDLVYFSPSELMWFGLRQLPYGYSDTSRLPDLTDGIFFPLPPEGQPGIFIERLPPFTGVLNPGWDPALPEFIPLDMYHAMKDALTFDPAHDEKWQKPKAETPEIPQGAHLPKVTLHFISGEADLQRLNPLLPFPVSLTNRPATMLKVTTQHPWVAAL